MKENILAKRYARALFQLANEHRLLDKIHGEVEFLADSIGTNSEMRRLLLSREIKKNEKKQVLEKLLQGRVSNIFYNFVTLLVQKNREALFLLIARQFGVLYDRSHKKVRVAAITAETLDRKFVKALKEFLDRKFDADVEIENRIDQSILGGLIVSVEGQVFDGSVQSQLRRLRDQLLAR
ncbi:MAG TPA: ATP synthase F1 subunit delta [bacterium]